MRDVKLLEQGERELWLGPDGRYTGRRWDVDATGARVRAAEPVHFRRYEDAIDWLYEPEDAKAKISRPSFFANLLASLRLNDRSSASGRRR